MGVQHDVSRSCFTPWERHERCRRSRQVGVKKSLRLGPRSVPGKIGAIAPARRLVLAMSAVLVLIAGTIVGTNLVTAGPVATCAAGGPCVVGDTGPGGGTVFYVDMSRPAGSQYWEVGGDLGTADWGCYPVDIVGTGTAIGSGAANTSLINAGCGTAGIAARVASTPAGGYSDWFLPSLDELNQLCKYARNQSTSPANQAVVCDSSGTLRPGFIGDWYWSSSQNTQYNAKAQYFPNGDADFNGKGNPFPIRAVRAF